MKRRAVVATGAFAVLTSGGTWLCLGPLNPAPPDSLLHPPTSTTTTTTIKKTLPQTPPLKIHRDPTATTNSEVHFITGDHSAEAENDEGVDIALGPPQTGIFTSLDPLILVMVVKPIEGYLKNVELEDLHKYFSFKASDPLFTNSDILSVERPDGVIFTWTKNGVVTSHNPHPTGKYKFISLVDVFDGGPEYSAQSNIQVEQKYPVGNTKGFASTSMNVAFVVNRNVNVDTEQIIVYGVNQSTHQQDHQQQTWTFGDHGNASVTPTPAEGAISHSGTATGHWASGVSISGRGLADGFALEFLPS